jgi:hypothetical protein
MFVLLSAGTSFAQQAAASASTASDAMPFEKGTVEISIIGGTSLPLSLFRADPDRNLLLASFQVGRVMAGGPNGNSLQLIVDVAPLMQIRQPDALSGWSVSPLFVRWNFPPAGEQRVRVFGEVAGALLFTTRPVPAPTTTRFNFLDQAGFGVRIEDTARRAWLIGYRFQHISNGGRAQPNPGANFNFVYGGVSFIR